MIQTNDEVIFQVFTYDLGNEGNELTIKKLKDINKYVRFVLSDMSDENALVEKLFKAEVIPEDVDAEYLVDNDEKDIIYIDQNGNPFCELRRIIAH